MTYVDRIVNTESYGKNNVDTGDDIDGDVPEMKESNNVSEGEDYNQDDHDTYLDVTEKKESHNKNTDHSQPNISPQFIPNYLICFPSSIHFTVTEFVGRFCRFNNFCH